MVPDYISALPPPEWDQGPIALAALSSLISEVEKHFRLPHGATFHEDIDLLVWKPVGVVTEPLVDKILEFLDHHELSRPKPFNRFTDTSALEAMELNPHYVFQVALYRRMIFAGQRPAKSAFCVIKPEIAEIIRIHAMVATRSPLEVAIFDHYQGAATWLDVPLTRLQSGA